MAALTPQNLGVQAQPSLIAQALAREFSAPVWLVDAPNARKLASAGGDDDRFPGFAPEILRRIGEVAGQSTLVLPDPDAADEVVWLAFTAPVLGHGVVGLAGFEVGGTRREFGPSGWGPSCPEPALTAWAREVLARLHGVEDSRIARPRSVESARTTGDGGDGVVLARLIRRLRISDAAPRFQQLACNALRSALGVQALAWTPCQHSEPVVTIGDLGGLRPNDFRAFIPTPATDLVRIQNAPGGLAAPDVRRMIAVSADSQASLGWLIAVNPLDERDFSPADAALMQPVASLVATQQTNARVYADLKELLFGVIRALTAAIDAKDPYTCGHSERVARIAVRLAEELGMPAGQRSDLYLTGLLHDVGKIGVDDAVLKKPGPLTPEEYRQIQRHVEIGVQILLDLKKLGHLLPGVRHHHESLDGNGYPCGLAGDQIPYEARILAVADAFDAMSSTRPYRRRLTPTQIDEIFRKGAGVQWDPKVVEALFACRMDLEMIRQKGLGESLQVAVTGALGRP